MHLNENWLIVLLRSQRRQSITKVMQNEKAWKDADK